MFLFVFVWPGGVASAATNGWRKIGPTSGPWASTQPAQPCPEEPTALVRSLASGSALIVAGPGPATAAGCAEGEPDAVIEPGRIYVPGAVL